MAFGRIDPQSQSDRARRLRHNAESLAAPMPALLVEAERVANSVAFGIHGRRRVGQGETFWQYRHYAEGDARSAIDWRKSAKAPRNTHLYVRDNEWEAAQSVFFFVDRSHSMNYRSGDNLPRKQDAAIVTALALALLLGRAGERIANLSTLAPAATGRAAFNRFANELLSHERLNHNTYTGTPPERKVPAHAKLLIISDFLSPEDDIKQSLDRFTAQAATGHLLQINDPCEEDFPFSGRTQFEAPTGKKNIVFGRAENLKEDYRRSFFAHRATLSDRATKTGWCFTCHRTDRPLESTLLSLYLDLSGGKLGPASS
jgi:uncharacterized protein (DUF58 family)